MSLMRVPYPTFLLPIVSFLQNAKGEYLIIMKAQGPVYLLAEVAAGK